VLPHFHKREDAQSRGPREGSRGPHSALGSLANIPWVNGEDEHNVSGRKANSLPRLSGDTIIPAEEL